MAVAILQIVIIHLSQVIFLYVRSRHSVNALRRIIRANTWQPAFCAHGGLFRHLQPPVLFVQAPLRVATLQVLRRLLYVVVSHTWDLVFLLQDTFEYLGVATDLRKLSTHAALIDIFIIRWLY